MKDGKENIKNILTKDVKLPNLPVDDFVASTETLAIDANEDRDVLAGAGQDVSLIDDLTSLSGALRYCQANCFFTPVTAKIRTYVFAGYPEDVGRSEFDSPFIPYKYPYSTIFCLNVCWGVASLLGTQ